jgi:hypothetical protein
MRAIGGVVGSMIVLLLSWTAFAVAAQVGGENPSFMVVEASTTTEKVINVDYKARTVTLQGDSGSTRTVKVSDEVRNLNQVRKGDVVTMEVNTTVAVEVQPGPGETKNIGSESQTSALPGAKPSGIRTIEGTLRTRVEAIDYDARTVTFKNRKGVLTTYKIGEQAKRFNEIRRNDMLLVEYSQTIAVSVK